MMPDSRFADGDARSAMPPASRISQIVAPWAARSPEHPAIVESSGTWSYGRLFEMIGSTARWLAAKGVRAGDRVVIVNENCRAAVALLLAVADLDAWVILVNARLSDRELDEIRDHSDARLVVFTVDASPTARLHAGRLGAATEDVSGLGGIAFTTRNERAEPAAVEADAGQVAALVYTSGTTGGPKAAMLTHRNLLFMARASGAVRSLGPEDRFYGVLPISHIVGLSVVLLGTLLYGATLHLAPRFNPSAALKALERDRITVMLGVPAMFALLLEYIQAKGPAATISHPGLRLLGACGAPLDPAIKASVEQMFGLTLHNGYGITECSPTIAQTRVDQPQADCTVGRVLPGVEVKLVGHDDMAAPDGDVGELWVRGPNVMKGYYRDAAATEAAIDAEGWFNTRDLACFRNGQLFIVGRTKELIIRFGFNVFPPEIEAVLNAHPAVLQSAVIGHRVDGNEEIVAFVQPLSGAAVCPAELADHAARLLAPYKRPTRIVLVDCLPTGPTGKILKARLAERAESPSG